MTRIEKTLNSRFEKKAKPIGGFSSSSSELLLGNMKIQFGLNIHNQLKIKKKKFSFLLIEMLASGTCINLIILVIMVTDVIGVSYDEWSSFDENDNGIIQSSNNVRVELNDWDSNLYGKPICLKIPSNMTLCSDINYKEMKVPNLLGHETLDEVGNKQVLSFSFVLFNSFTLFVFWLTRRSKTSRLLGRHW